MNMPRPNWQFSAEHLGRENERLTRERDEARAENGRLHKKLAKLKNLIPSDVRYVYNRVTSFRYEKCVLSKDIVKDIAEELAFVLGD